MIKEFPARKCCPRTLSRLITLIDSPAVMELQKCFQGGLRTWRAIASLEIFWVGPPQGPLVISIKGA